MATPPGSQMAGLGPFVLTKYEPGQRLTFARNPHYWRPTPPEARCRISTASSIEIVPTQDAEDAPAQAGSIDLMSQADLRPEDYAALKRLHDQGTLRVTKVGPGVDPNLLWFNLTPGGRQPRRQSLPAARGIPAARCRTRSIAQAIARAGLPRGRHAGVRTRDAGQQDVVLGRGAGLPARSRAARGSLLASIGLTDRNGDGMLEDAVGRAGPVHRRDAEGQHPRARRGGPAGAAPPGRHRRGHRGARAALAVPALRERATTTRCITASRPARSTRRTTWTSGSARARAPVGPGAGEAGRRRGSGKIDDLMAQQVAAPSLAERQSSSREVQRIFGEQLPAIYLVAPDVSVAMSARVGGARPALLDPKVLWAADELFVERPN